MSQDTASLITLKRVQRLIDEVVFEKFNWPESWLDANAIQLLNEVPGEVTRQIDTLEQTIANKKG